MRRVRRAPPPERVSKLVLYGAYARGWRHRPDAPGRAEYEAIIELTRTGWGKENPAFRQVFTSRFVPDGTAEQLGWWNDLCRKTTTPEIAARLLKTRAEVDVTALLSQVRAPTLVLHARNDQVCPIAEARLLASGIPGAEFVELDSRNHVLLEHEPAWRRFSDAVLEFLGAASPTGASAAVFDALSTRERSVLALICEGLSNAEIGERLSISEKTVRNHVSNVFDKLGVWTRAQAMVLARDRSFRG